MITSIDQPFIYAHYVLLEITLLSSLILTLITPLLHSLKLEELHFQDFTLSMIKHTFEKFGTGMKHTILSKYFMELMLG